MSYLLPHLHSGFAVDQAIMSVSQGDGSSAAGVRGPGSAARRHGPTAPTPLPQEEDRVVCIRFGHDYDDTCMQMDEVRELVERGPPPSPPGRSAACCGLAGLPGAACSAPL